MAGQATTWAAVLAILIPLCSGLAAQSLSRARELVKSGRAAEAVPIYRTLVDASPDDVKLRMNLAIAHFTAKQYSNAIQQCEVVLKQQPGLAPALLFLGASHFQLGRHADAIEPLRQVLEAQPTERNARLMLAETLLQLERYREAVREFEMVSKSLPNNPRVWYGLERGYTHLAEATSKELERTEPNSPYLSILMGDMWFQQKLYGRAFYHYRHALAQDADLPGVHSALAAIYRALGHPEWAAIEEERERSIAAPSPPEEHYLRAKEYRELARQAFGRLRALQPSSQLHELLAREHEQRQSHPEAIEEWRRALDLSPDSRVLKQGLAVSLRAAGDLEAALLLFRELVEQQPESAELQFLLGSVLLTLGRTGEAIPHLQKAEFPAARGELGRAYLQTGKAEDAIPHLEASLGIDEDGSRHFQLSRAYLKAGRQEDAARMLLRYRELEKAASERTKTAEMQFRIKPP